MTLLLIDGNSLLWRSAFAGTSRPVLDDAGYVQTLAFHYLIELLDGYERRFNARSVFVLDGGSDFRKAIDPNYKGDRDQNSEARVLVRKTFRLVVAALEAIQGNYILVNGVEADDVISILARRCRKTDTRAVIVSEDQDLHQCLGGTVTQFHPAKDLELTKDEALAPFGGCVKSYIIYKALRGGDDNIPGFAGIGEKKALELALFCQGDWTKLFGPEAAEVYGKRKAYKSLFQPDAQKLFSDQIRLVRTATQVEDLGPWQGDPSSGQSLVPGAVEAGIKRALAQLASPRQVVEADWLAFLRRYDCLYLKGQIERIFSITADKPVFAEGVQLAVCDAPPGRPVVGRA